MQNLGPIEYGAEIRDRVLAMHADSVGLPDYDKYIEDHLGGRVLAFRRRLIPQALAFTDLEGMDILDFGCGTGSTTVAIAERASGSRITALDIDRSSLEIAAMRLAHHGLDGHVGLCQIAPVTATTALPLRSASFDFVMMNGVLEHVVPFSTRENVILETWRVLRPNGRLFISETPNALWPLDRHTTGLPLIPWLPSALAHRVAVAFGRHCEQTNLDARGRRGMTYWEIVRPLRRAGLHFEVLNLTLGGNRLLPAGLSSGEVVSTKRKFGAFLLERGGGGLQIALGVPTVALSPFIEFLCLQKK
jgi:ubiquinone/menaquinone biosynthesis C-methylase UbiE